MAENVAFVPAMGTNEGAHVFDDAQDRNLGLAEHRQPLARVDQRDVLRGGNDHRAFQRHALGDGELRVAGSGRHVDHQDIQRRPRYVVHHLRQGALHHRAAPDHGRVFFDQESDRHGLEAKLDDGRQLAAVRLGLFGDAQQTRHARPVDVGVEQSDLVAERLQAQRQIYRHRRFADAALAAGDRDDGADAGNARWRGRAALAVVGRAGDFGVLVCGQHRGDRQHAGKGVHCVLAGLAQGLGLASARGCDLQGKTDMAVLQHQALDHVLLHDAAPALRVDDVVKRLQHIVSCRLRHGLRLGKDAHITAQTRNTRNPGKISECLGAIRTAATVRAISLEGPGDRGPPAAACVPPISRSFCAACRKA